MKFAKKTVKDEAQDERIEALRREIAELRSTVKTLSKLVSQMYYEDDDEDDDFDGDRHTPTRMQPSQQQIFGHVMN